MLGALLEDVPAHAQLGRLGSAQLRPFLTLTAHAQVLLEDGPTTYSLGDLRDATKLAQKIVQSYGMTELGITMHAPKQGALGFMKRAFEV